MVAKTLALRDCLHRIIRPIWRLSQATQLRVAMRLVPKSILILLTAYSLQLTAFAAEALTSQELLRDAEKYDGKTITFQGEVIGDILIQGEFAWINLRDQQGALGVFVAREALSAVEHLGGYATGGDIISARGVFNRSCIEHGGDTDIHAEKITVITPGETIVHSVEPEKVKAAIILGAIVFVLACIHLIIRKFR